MLLSCYIFKYKLGLIALPNTEKESVKCNKMPKHHILLISFDKFKVSKCDIFLNTMNKTYFDQTDVVSVFYIRNNFTEEQGKQVGQEFIHHSIWYPYNWSKEASHRLPLFVLFLKQIFAQFKP